MLEIMMMVVIVVRGWYNGNVGDDGDVDVDYQIHDSTNNCDQVEAVRLSIRVRWDEHCQTAPQVVFVRMTIKHLNMWIIYLYVLMIIIYDMILNNLSNHDTNLQSTRNIEP